MTIRTFRTEFPSYDPATLPAIPADWTDVSWKNDTCPSFLAAAGLTWEILVFVEWADPADRELDNSSRFFANQHTNDGPSGAEGFHEGDDWEALLAAVAKRAAELRAAEKRSGADRAFPLYRAIAKGRNGVYLDVREFRADEAGAQSLLEKYRAAENRFGVVWSLDLVDKGA